MAAAPDLALNWFKKVPPAPPPKQDVRAFHAARARGNGRPCLIKRNPIAPTRHPVKNLNRFKDFGVFPT